MSSVNATDGGSSNKLTIDDADDMDDDLDASLAQGCLKLGNDEEGRGDEYNNNLELRTRQRFAVLLRGN